nr:uncharacterized protein LOC109430690 [Aedes albopictus]
MKHYLTVKAKVQGAEIDPWAIGETIETFELKISKIEQQKNGEYLIATEDEDTAERLLTLVRIDDGTEVEVIRHPSLNGCKGVIKCPAIRNKSEQEILDHLKAQKVVRVQARGENGIYILSFDLPQPPKEIKVGALTTKVSTFYPRPLICRKCFMYGHTAGACRNNPACEACGQYHEGRCPPPKCRNCGGAHHPTDQKCKVYKQEMSINRMMVDKGIPAVKARAMLRKETKKGYIVPPKAAPEARRVTSSLQAKKPEPPGEGSSKTGPKRKSAPTPLVAVHINSSSSSSSSEDEEEHIVPPKSALPTRPKGKGKANAAGRSSK